MGVIEEIDGRVLERVVRRALGDGSLSVSRGVSEQLAGGTVAGVFRLRGTAWKDGAAPVPWSCVLKILHEWERDGDPQCWSREARFYPSGVYDCLPAGLTVPRCYELEEKGGEYRLWLEDVAGRRGLELSAADYGVAARGLGRFQGQYMAGRPLPDFDWLAGLNWRRETTGDMGPYAIGRIRNGELDGSATHLRLKGMLSALDGLWARRDDLSREVESLPRTLAHRDFHADNIFARENGGGTPETVLIDWDCAGVGVVGEDIGDVVAEAMVYFRYSPRQAEVLLANVLGEYAAGLADAGWRGSPDLALRGVINNWSVHWCFRIARGVIHAPDPRDREGLVERLDWMLSRIQRGAELQPGKAPPRRSGRG